MHWVWGPGQGRALHATSNQAKDCMRRGAVELDHAGWDIPHWTVAQPAHGGLGASRDVLGFCTGCMWWCQAHSIDPIWMLFRMLDKFCHLFLPLAELWPVHHLWHHVHAFVHCVLQRERTHIREFLITALPGSTDVISLILQEQESKLQPKVKQTHLPGFYQHFSGSY